MMMMMMTTMMPQLEVVFQSKWAKVVAVTAFVGGACLPGWLAIILNLASCKLVMMMMMIFAAGINAEQQAETMPTISLAFLRSPFLFLARLWSKRNNGRRKRHRMRNGRLEAALIAWIH